MQTKAKSNSVVTHALTETGTILINVLGAGTVEFDPKKAHEKNREWAEIHGWLQRLVDGAAKSRDPKTGKPASAEEKMGGIRRLVEHYESGADYWNLTREGGIGDDSITVRAIAEVKGIDVEEVRKRLETRAAALNSTVAKVLYAIRTSAGDEGSRVRDAINRLRPASTINGDEILSDL